MYKEAEITDALWDHLEFEFKDRYDYQIRRNDLDGVLENVMEDLQEAIHNRLTEAIEVLTEED